MKTCVHIELGCTSVVKGYSSDSGTEADIGARLDSIVDVVVILDETGSSIFLIVLRKTLFIAGEMSRSSRKERVIAVWRMSPVGKTDEDMILFKTLDIVPSIICFTCLFPLFVSSGYFH